MERNGLEAPQWPWEASKPGKPSDLGSGTSSVYAEWLRQQEAKKAGQATPSHEHGEPATASRGSALPVPPRPVQVYPPPPVPSVERRKEAWRAIYGNSRWTTLPVCDPFEMALPMHLPFEKYVSGRNGVALARINRDLTDPAIVITWVKSVSTNPDMDQMRPERLIIGFTEMIDAQERLSQANISSMYAVWQHLTLWLELVHRGTPMALDQYLSDAPGL